MSVAALRLGRMADRERELRQQGLLASARFAARTVASEIDLRWRILETEATSSVLRETLSELNETLSATRAAGAENVRSVLLAHPSWGSLRGWLQERYYDHFETAKAVSWFVTSDAGIQVAKKTKS